MIQELISPISTRLKNTYQITIHMGNARTGVNTKHIVCSAVCCWSPFHTFQTLNYLDISRRGCMWEHKCPNQLPLTLSSLYPASCYFMRLTWNCKKNIPGWRRRVIYMTQQQKCLTGEMERFRTSVSKSKSQNCERNSRNTKRLCCLWPHYEPATWLLCNLCHVLPLHTLSKCEP